MNARPGTQTMAQAHVSRSGPAGNAFLRVLAGVPLAAQLAPIVGAFVCSQLLYARIAGHPHGLDLGILGGLATFFLLFVVLRFVDDLDDLKRDHPLEVHGKAERSALRGRLVTGLAATVTGIVLLNVDDPHALAAALGACVLAFAAPFGFKRLFPRSLAAGSLVFEGTPLAIFGYGYFFWRDAGGPQLVPAAAACVVILFWAGYEFWKFSRKVHSTAMQPASFSRRAGYGGRERIPRCRAAREPGAARLRAVLAPVFDLRDSPAARLARLDERFLDRRRRPVVRHAPAPLGGHGFRGRHGSGAAGRARARAPHRLNLNPG